MSPEQFIIGAAAAAITLHSNSPLVDAIGAIAPENPTNGYPPWRREKSFFDTTTNETYCEYNDFAVTSPQPSLMFAVGPSIFGMKIEDNMIHTRIINCPWTGYYPRFRATYEDKLVSYHPEGSGYIGYSHWSHGGSEIPYPKDIALDPLKIYDSSIRDKMKSLSLAASKIQFEPRVDRYPDTPDYPNSDDEESTFFNDSDDENNSAGDDDEEQEPLQFTFNAESKYNPSTASTELPIEELEEVCSAAMHLVKQKFKDLNKLCAAHFNALYEE
ncbi:hypothetical protein FOZ62_002928, partial [Perkinsus olseni]